MPATRTPVGRGGLLAWAMALLVLGSCASGRGADAGDTRSRVSRGQGVSFNEEALVAASEPLLELLKQRLPGMQVREIPGACPEVIMRGRSTVTTSSSPAIYLDGARATNNCILRDLGTAGLGLVEVFPSGVPTRAGYRSHPYGVIIIFTRGPATAAATGDSVP